MTLEQSFGLQMPSVLMPNDMCRWHERELHRRATSDHLKYRVVNADNDNRIPGHRIPQNSTGLEGRRGAPSAPAVHPSIGGDA